MKLVKYMLRGLLAIIMLIAIGIVGAYSYITSERGMDYITATGSAAASSDDMRITLGTLRGRLFHDITLSNISIADKEGVWLTAENIHVIWQPSRLIQKQPPVERIEVGRIHLMRQPVMAESADTQTTEPGASLSLREIAAYLPQQVAVKDITIDEAATGSAQRLTLNASGNADAYTIDLATLEGVATTLNATITPRAQDFSAKLVFNEAAGGVLGRMLDLPHDTTLAITADAAADLNGALVIREARAQAGTLTLDISGTYDSTKSVMDVKGALDAPDMVIIQALAGSPMSGSAHANFAASGTLDALKLALDLKSERFVMDTNRLENTTLTANGTLNAAAFATNAFTANGTLNASTTHNDQPATAKLAVAVADSILRIADMQAAYGKNSAKGNIIAKGTLQQFDMESDLALSMPEGSGTLVLKGKVDSEAQRYNGDAEGTLTYEKQTFTFATTLDANAETADISKLALKGPGTDVNGALTINIPTQLADGKLTIRANDLAPLGRALAMQLAGSLTADIALSKRGNAQGIDAKATAKNLVAMGMRVEAANLTAKSSDLFAGDQLAATLDATRIVMGDLAVEKITASANGSLRKQLAWNVTGNGLQATTAWDVGAAGTVSQPSNDSYTLAVANLQGHYAGAPIRLAKPVSIAHAPARTSVTPLTLELAGGSITAQGESSARSVSGHVSIANIALHQLPAVSLPEGTLNGTVNIKGTGAAPELAWDLKTHADMDGIVLNATAKGGWVGRALTNALALSSDKATAQVDTTLDAKLSLSPFATDLGDTTAISGRVKAGLPLDMLNARLRADGHRLGGMFSGDATLQGTLGNPSFNGAFALADGKYDHSETGVCLRDMRARITGSTKAVTLESFTATDNKKKQFTANGALTLGGTPSFKGAAKFDDFRLFCGGMMHGNIDGTLNAGGTTKAMSIAGALQLGPLNVQIPGARVSSEIPEVPVQWVRPGEKAEETTEPSVIGLDITIHAPQQLFVRGRGLDAEFAGDLAITGTADAPKVDGQFSKKRGQFVLLDRVLKLDTATLKFQGPMPPSPFLDVKATTVAQDITVGVNLSGTATKPALKLTSSPTRPQDEVLALLLFGRQLDKISPFEAIQLAQATRTLAGLDGGGPGVLGTIRDTLGLDRLDVSNDGDSTEDVSVSTGKYVTDDVYVGVVQGSKPEDREVVTEITLTPAISGKTAVDSVGNQSVGVEWKRDY